MHLRFQGFSACKDQKMFESDKESFSKAVPNQIFDGFYYGSLGALEQERLQFCLKCLKVRDQQILKHAEINMINIYLDKMDRMLDLVESKQAELYSVLSLSSLIVGDNDEFCSGTIASGGFH